MPVSDRVVRDAVNSLLHAGLGVDEPCESACTHVVTGPWTALGVANVMGRRAAAVTEAQR